MQGGFGIFYNHQDRNNAILRVNWDMMYAEVKSIGVIEKDKEVHVHYGNNYPWEMAGIEKVTIESSKE